MNNNIFEGNWKQFKGDIQEKWGKLTDDSLDQINGNREKLIGHLQESYGMLQEEAEKEVSEFEKQKT